MTGSGFSLGLCLLQAQRGGWDLGEDQAEFLGLLAKQEAQRSPKTTSPQDICNVVKAHRTGGRNV